MKNKLFKFLPNFIKRFKYSDKIAHMFYGTLFYLFLNTIFTPELSLFLTFTLALGVEFYDKHKGGRADMLDLLSTMILPIILFFIIKT